MTYVVPIACVALVCLTLIVVAVVFGGVAAYCVYVAANAGWVVEDDGDDDDGEDADPPLTDEQAGVRKPSGWVGPNAGLES